jgi:hypothetical protein
VDVLHQDTLVLEAVTLGLEVESVVTGHERGPQRLVRRYRLQVLVDLAALTVLSQESPENTHPPQPLDLGRHPRLGGTLPLTGAGVSAKTLGGASA